MPEPVPAPAPAKPKQLRMLWPTSRLTDPPRFTPAAGYKLRTYRPGDEPGFFRVMGLAGFEGWNQEKLEPWLLKILPDGWFIAEHVASGELVATTMATHNPTPLHPFGGELGWVAGHPEHTGKGLGLAVCAGVTARFLQAGYRNIYLNTDDWRLPAIRVYLKLGYVPFLHAADMRARWTAVYAKLEWPCRPETWVEAEA